MQVRCQRCSFVFTLSRETLMAVLKEIEETQTAIKHYNLECPKCRRQIKVPVKQIQRLRPLSE
jgi:hypothetical protein